MRALALRQWLSDGEGHITERLRSNWMHFGMRERKEAGIRACLSDRLFMGKWGPVLGGLGSGEPECEGKEAK